VEGQFVRISLGYHEIFKRLIFLGPPHRRSGMTAEGADKERHQGPRELDVYLNQYINK
jgi:hypothetical protein